MADNGPVVAQDRAIGSHRATIELPDVLHLRVDGDVELDHIKGFLEVVGEFPGRVHILRDARRSRVVKPAAREYMLKHMPRGKVVSFISYGAPFHGRTMITMLGKAIQLLLRESPVVGFTNTEEDARAWIDKIRADRGRG